MIQKVISHQDGYHPELPSFRDRYLGVDEDIVRMSYSGIFLPERRRYITGGIATQFYCNPEHRRGSNDIDVNDLDRLTSEEFRSRMAEDLLIVDERSPSFPDYNAILMNKNHSFVLHICNFFLTESSKFYFNVEFSRYSAQHHQRMLDIFYREFDNSKEYCVNDVQLRVLDPADIIARKIRRLINYYKYEEISEFSPPADPKEHLDIIWNQREKLSRIELYASKGCPECGEESVAEKTILRSMTDIYDIKLLGSSEFFDAEYFEEVLKEYEKHGVDRKEVDKIFTPI